MIMFADPVMVELQRKFPLPELKAPSDFYHDMVENIVGQQLSGRVARVIFNRFKGLFEDDYPTPNLVLSTSDETLRSVGLSGAKTKYVKALAEFTLHHDLSLQRVSQYSDEELIKLLTQIKGVGVWTAQMLLIFSLSRNDVFPVDDLAIQQGMRELYGVKVNGKQFKQKLIKISDKWKPNRTIGSRLVWAYVNNKKQNATRR
ncbi:3-methyladenine DNA glycosylase [Tenuifilaceae bacterium CYCD]|nr:3-methyladenine DNA glycosylase [Tenuifilaceae bacterium CYCD]